MFLRVHQFNRGMSRDSGGIVCTMVPKSNNIASRGEEPCVSCTLWVASKAPGVKREQHRVFSSGHRLATLCARVSFWRSGVLNFLQERIEQGQHAACMEQIQNLTHM